MNYFQPYSLPLDDALVAAWDSQLAELAESPILAQAVAKRSADLFPRFAACYAQLRALPRGTRRALQRRLARAGELSELLPGWQRKLAQSLAGAALLLALAQSAQAATITVHAKTPPDLIPGDGKCSLIEAIINANNDDQSGSTDCAAGSGADTIVLPAKKTITLTSSYSYQYSSDTGLPAITSAITIEGNGGKIVRGASGAVFRLMAVSSSGNLTLRNVTLSGGNSSVSGGAVFNNGSLTIEHSTISGDAASERGGGVMNYANGTLRIESSTLSGNQAVRGGAVFNDKNGATTTITNSTISGNSVDYGGGGVMNDALSSVTIRSSTISGNHSGYYGGGVMNYGEFTIENSTISGNTAKTGGGGIYNDYFVHDSITTEGTVTINNSTIVGNTVAPGFGGGIRNEGILNLNRSLISGNHGNFGNEIYHNTAFTGSVTADNFNLFGVGNSPGVEGFAPGATDIVPAVALAQIVGPLKNNGGATFTHALMPGSPALDAAPVDSDCPANDQRGITRPQGGGCDVGAFELQPKGKKKGK